MKILILKKNVISIIALIIIGLAVFYFGFIKNNDTPSVWSRVDESTIMINGDIEEGSFEEFQKVFDNKVKTVIITSGGGNTYEAVQIGLVLKEANVDVIVRKYALSSAANYLFISGKKKIIEDGIVGFHGNTIANVNMEGGLDNLINNIDYPWYAKLIGAQSKQKKIIKKTMELEKKFFSELGISQELFDISQLKDMGMNDDIEYFFLLPSKETFEKYGIRNVKGDHSKKWIDKFYKMSKDKGYTDPKLLIESSR